MSQIDRTMVEAVNIIHEKDNDIKEELLDLIDSVNELGTGVYVNEDAEAGQVPVADGDGGYTWSDIESGVASVNGKTGTVVLDAEDVGAIPDTETIPTKTSDLINDSGFITSAPVSSVNTKTGAVVLSASDVGALPSSTTIPSKTSDLTNDSGYITSTDIPVQSVNTQTGVVVLTASDVGALPNTTTIPTKTSDLINDSGFITSAPVSSVNTKTGAVVLAAGDIGVTPPTGQSFTTVQGAVDSHDQSIGNLTNVVDELDVDVALLSADKQDKSDNSLSTTAKTVVGAINELKQDKVDYDDIQTSVSSSSTDAQVPSAKLFYDTVGTVEATLNAIRGVS